MSFSFTGQPSCVEETSCHTNQTGHCTCLCQGSQETFCTHTGAVALSPMCSVYMSKCGGSVQRSRRVDTKVTFPAGDLILEGRVWTSTPGRDVGVVLCDPHPLHGGN